MNKKEVVELVSKKTGFSKKDVELLTDALLDEIQDALARNEKVRFMGFGTFEVRVRAARNGKNPRTGEKILVPEMKMPAFKAGKVIKEAIR